MNPTTAAPIPGSTPTSVNQITPTASVPSQSPNMGVMEQSIANGNPGSNITASQSTPSNMPSSSASVNLNKTATAATQQAINPAPAANPNAAAASSISSILSKYGGPSVSASDIQGLLDNKYSLQDATTLLTGLASSKAASDAANQDEQNAQNARQASYDADLANQNATYAQESQQLATDRQNAIGAATQQLGAANSSAISSDNTGMISHIGSQYDMAQQTLTLQAQQAKAALDSGNATAYNAIVANMSNVRAQLNTNIQNLISGVSSNQTNEAAAASNEADKVAAQKTADQQKSQGIADKELQTITNESAPQLAALPNDTATFTPAQMATLQGTPGYSALISANLSPNDALGYIKNAATGNSQISKENALAEKTQTDTAKAQISLMNAQANDAYLDAKTKDLEITQANMQSVASVKGGAYMDALNTLGNNQTTAQGKQSLNTMAALAQGGDENGMKQNLVNDVTKTLPTADQGTFTGIYSTAVAAGSLMAKIQALPASQKAGIINGNIQDIATKFGQNPDPALQSVAAEAAHLSTLYKANVFGKRAVTSSIPGLDSLLGSAKNNESLNVTDIQAFQSTANDVLGGLLQSKIGSDSYQKIFGDSGAMGTSATPAASTSASDQSLISAFFSQGNFSMK